MGELLSAGERVFASSRTSASGTRPTAAWDRFTGRKHELVFVFKVGNAPHINTFGLGDTGRYRTNVWDYAGINTLRRGPRRRNCDASDRQADRAGRRCHPRLLRRGDIVLDPFGGSGTTLIAADKTGRQARLVEFDRAYCDRTLRRFEQVTGKKARLVATGQSFEDVGEERQVQPDREEGGR